MDRAHSNAIVLFARDPVPGQVKTRLQSQWDPDTVCRLYQAFLEDTRTLLLSLNEVDLFVAVSSTGGSSYFDSFEQAGFRLIDQQGAGLGDRMRLAFEERFKAGYERVVIIGSDSPTLPIEYLEKALASDRDMVLGPSTDGGYYLIGMKGRVQEVFDKVEWGGEQVLASTLDHIDRLGVSLDLLAPWYDVDHPEDLAFLKVHLELMARAGLEGGDATRKLIKEIVLDKAK